MVLRGSFEGEDSEDGRRIYRLRWQQAEKAIAFEDVLTERERQAGLFIRYLICKGLLSEMPNLS